MSGLPVEGIGLDMIQARETYSNAVARISADTHPRKKVLPWIFFYQRMGLERF
jgi:hypothetical protein